MQTQNSEQLQHLEKEPPISRDEAASVDAMNAQAWEVRQVDLSRTLALSLQAEQQAAALGYTAGYARSLYQQGWCLMHRSDYAAAEERLKTALEHSRHAGDAVLEGDCLIFLGTTYYSWGNYPAALDYYLQAHGVFCRDEPSSGFSSPDSSSPRFSLGEADALDGIGCIYHTIGDHEKALSHHLQALRLREQLPQKNSLNISLNNVGSMYGELGNYADALNYYQACLDLCRQDLDFGLQVCCLSNLAETYDILGLKADALAAALKAVQTAQTVGNRVHECSALLTLGRHYRKAGEAEQGLALFEDALALARKLENQGLECQSLIALGQIRMEQGEAASAEMQFRKALEIAVLLDLKDESITASLHLAETYEQQGDLRQALTYYKQYRFLEKEVYNEAVDKRSKTMLIEMQVERARQEAELHRVKNVELAEANRQLQEQAELLHRQANELARLAMEDGLTGLANRRSLEGFLAQQFADAVRHQRPLTVVLADIDHFKQVNDRFGHQVGDEVLMTVALLFRQTCRVSDLAARYGGEEFALVLPETTAVQAQVFCERLRVAVEQYAWSDIRAGLAVTLSQGLSDDLRVANHERLLRLADQRLYRAKQEGRNQVIGL